MAGEFDITVLGGGVVGCSMARALALCYPEARIALLEKEAELAAHTSGRNSGVVHSGFHIKPRTLRATLCVEGARRLKQYCRSRQIPIIESGSLVVATSESEIPILEELERRARSNSVSASWVERNDIPRIEKYARGITALHIPEDAIFESKTYVKSLAREAEALGVKILLNTEADCIRSNGSLELGTGGKMLRTRLLINCAGVYAAKIARSLGLGKNFSIVPFRGEYYEIPSHYGFLVRSIIYPAPDLRFPFLGIHFTKTLRNTILVGPNAVPAFGVENYSWRDVRPSHLFSFLFSDSGGQLLSSPSRLKLAAREILSSISKKATLARARRLVPYLDGRMVRRSFSGIRPQLTDRWGHLTDELVLTFGEASVHILNAISPALTSSLQLADYMVNLLVREGYLPEVRR